MRERQLLQDPGYVRGVEGNQPIHKVTFEMFICHVRGVEAPEHIHQ